MNNARHQFEAIARANGGTDFSLKPDGRYAVQNIQSRWVYFKLGWEAGTKREPLTDEEICRIGAQVHGFLLCNEGQWGIEMARAIEAAHGITGEKNGNR